MSSRAAPGFDDDEARFLQGPDQPASLMCGWIATKRIDDHPLPTGGTESGLDDSTVPARCKASFQSPHHFGIAGEGGPRNSPVA